MKLQEIYDIIKPLIDIIINKYFKEKYDFIINIISIFNTKASEHALSVGDAGSSLSVLKCTWIYKIYYYLILLVFLICCIWIIYDIFKKNYYASNAYFSILITNQLNKVMVLLNMKYHDFVSLMSSLVQPQELLEIHLDLL